MQLPRAFEKIIFAGFLYTTPLEKRGKRLKVNFKIFSKKSLFRHPKKSECYFTIVKVSRSCNGPIETRIRYFPDFT